MLSAEAAQKLLGAVRKAAAADAPVMFFGTREIAWLPSKDVTPWADGVAQGLHTKGSKKAFKLALEQVRVVCGVFV